MMHSASLSCESMFLRATDHAKEASAILWFAFVNDYYLCTSDVFRRFSWHAASKSAGGCCYTDEGPRSKAKKEKGARKLRGYQQVRKESQTTAYSHSVHCTAFQRLLLLDPSATCFCILYRSSSFPARCLDMLHSDVANASADIKIHVNAPFLMSAYFIILHTCT